MTDMHPTEEGVYPTEEDMYPTEDPVPTTASREINAAHKSGPSAEDVARAREDLKRRKAAHDERIRAVVGDGKLPSLEALRDERAALLQQVRHHKDEHDSLALDIEAHESSSAVCQTAARVQRYEVFAGLTEKYVDEELPAQIDQVVTDDQRKSEEEIAEYIQELQAKRERTLKKISDAQNRSGAGKKKGNASRSATVEDEDDEPTKQAIQHVQENANAEEKLADKVKTFRALKTKLHGELVRERKASKTMEESLQALVRNQELANARDARQARELNAQNAILTTNTQMLLSQLNAEHYGYDQAPTAQQMIEERKKYEATPEPTPANNDDAAQGRVESMSMGSRRQSLSKPPLVASKPTAAQRSRDEALQLEREEVESRRKGSEVGSYQSSRRQSLSKPPLVASKPTASQRSRDEALQQERAKGQLQQRSRGMSISSDARPPSVASKSTASQRNRESA